MGNFHFLGNASEIEKMAVSGNGSKNHCYRGDRALKFATGGYFEVNFSFLRVRE